MFFVNSKELCWSSLLDQTKLLTFFEHLESIGIKSPGRLTKMERCSDALKYMRFCVRANLNGEKAREKLEKIDGIEEVLSSWKTTLRRQKKKRDAHRLEATSKILPSLDSINTIMESEDLKEIFDAIMHRAQKGESISEADLRLATGVVCVPVMLGSSSRPGAVANCTQSEFRQGSFVDGVYVVSVAEHKTGILGSARLVFDQDQYDRVNHYLEHVRPLMVQKGDIPELFVMPGSQAIQKISNVTRILEAKLGVAIPTATMVRKMGTTAVARNCPEVTRNLVARQMNHDASTSSHYYQATKSDRDAAELLRQFDLFALKVAIKLM